MCWYDNLSGPGDPPRTAAFWKVQKAVSDAGDPFIDGDRGVWVLRLYMGEYAVAIGEREGRP